jgi:methionine synthase II (cobalamin-independent)
VTTGPRAEVVGSLLRPERLRRAREERAAGRLGPAEFQRVSPQCGFESAIGDHPLDEERQERKLRLVVEVAERAWAA